MQQLPRAFTPNVRYAEWLHKKEKNLYVGHWMQSKQGLENGTGLVSKSRETNIPSQNNQS
jgi:hypothetical protein